MSMQFLDFDVASSGAQVERSAAGNFIRYSIITVGTSGPRIRVKTDSHDDLVMKPGDKVRTAKSFTRLMVSAYDGIQVTGFLQVGEGSFDSDSVVGNVTVDGTVVVSSVTATVTVADNPKARTLASKAFSAYALCAAVAAKYSHVQLKNPAASGVNVYVKALRVFSNTIGLCGIGTYNTDLVTSSAFAVNKYAGGTAGLSAVKTEALAALGVDVPDLFGKLYLTAASADYLEIFDEPVLLVPGKGLTVWHPTVQSTLGVTFSLIEEAP